MPPTMRTTQSPTMFIVFEDDAAAIRTAFFAEGELSAAIELRRRFPGIVDNGRARECARTIAGWSREPAPPPAKVTPLRPRKRRQSTTIRGRCLALPIDHPARSHYPPPARSRQPLAIVSRNRRCSAVSACRASLSHRRAIALHCRARCLAKLAFGSFIDSRLFEMLQPNNLSIPCRFALKNVNIVPLLYKRSYADARLLLDRVKPA